MSKTLIELAYDFVAKQKSPVSFQKIWAYVKKEAGLSEDEEAKKIGQFYTNLMLDGRFVTLAENEWDLRSRQSYDKVHIDMKEIYSEVEDSEIDPEEEPEEKEYNEAIDGVETSEEKGEFNEGEEENSEESSNEDRGY